MFKKYFLITGFLILFLMSTMRSWFFKSGNCKVHPMLNIYILITRFLNFHHHHHHHFYFLVKPTWRMDSNASLGGPIFLLLQMIHYY